MSGEDIRKLFQLIDWMMNLPEELAQQFEQEIYDYEKEKKMPYITSVERRAMERGKKEGKIEGFLEAITLGLQKRFGEEGAQLLPAIREITDVDRFRAIQELLWTASSLDEVKQFVASEPQKN